MPTPLIVALIIGIGIIAFAACCVIGARHSDLPKRILAAVTFVPIALFCLWGFAAAMEPGDYHIVWRIGYGVVFLTCLFTIGWLVFGKRPQQDAEHDRTS